jgi:hypothetical protein
MNDDLFQTDMSWLDIGEQGPAPVAKSKGRYQSKGHFAMADECRQRISQTLKARYADPEQAQAKRKRNNTAPAIASNRGRKRTAESIAKSVANRTYTSTPESRAKTSATMMGHKVSEATREKIRQAALARGRPFQTPWGRFNSVMTAAQVARANGLANARNKIRAALEQGTKGYYYIKAKK